MCAYCYLRVQTKTNNLYNEINESKFICHSKTHIKNQINVNIEGKGVVDRSSTVIAKDPEGKQFLS